MTEIVNSNHIFYSKHNDSKREHILLQSVIHTSQMPENSIWSKLVEAFNYWLKVPKDKLEKINIITSLIQATTNTLNDVAENAAFRNGKPTANSLYTNSDALNSAYYSCFIILEKLGDLQNFEAIKIGNEFLLDLCRGCALETYWRDRVTCPSEDDYIKMAIRKTGSILRITIKLMQLYSNDKSDFNKLIDILAKFFHIYDDYLNLYLKDQYLLYKNGLDNFKEGKFNFPIVHAIQNKSEDSQLINIIRQKTADEDVIKHALTLLEKFGSLKYTKETLKKFKEEANTETEKFEKNLLLDKIFDDIFVKLEAISQESK